MFSNIEEVGEVVVVPAEMVCPALGASSLNPFHHYRCYSTFIQSSSQRIFTISLVPCYIPHTFHSYSVHGPLVILPIATILLASCISQLQVEQEIVTSNPKCAYCRSNPHSILTCTNRRQYQASRRHASPLSSLASVTSANELFPIASPLSRQPYSVYWHNLLNPKNRSMLPSPFPDPYSYRCCSRINVHS